MSVGFVWLLFLLSLVAAVVIVLVIAIYKPLPRERMAIIHRGKKKPTHVYRGAIRVMTWNIQFCAGVTKLFFFDVLDERPKEVIEVDSQEVEKIFPKMIEVIKQVDPDILLLQEVDAGSRRVQYRDQVHRIEQALAEYLPYSCSSSYVDTMFHPHIYVRGAFRMRLMTLSRFPIREAMRYALPQLPLIWIDRIFRMQRHYLSTRIQLDSKKEVVILNTHLEAYTKGSQVLAWQLQALDKEFLRLEKQGVAWCIGGDFNLLPNKEARTRLDTLEKTLYNTKPELPWLMERWNHLPTKNDLQGVKASAFYGYAPDGLKQRKLDRTLDYFFYSSKLEPKSYGVMQKEGIEVSDHVPFVAEFTF